MSKYLHACDAKPDQPPEMLFIFPVVNWHERFSCQYHLGAAYVRAYLKFKGIYTVQLIHPAHQSIRYDDFINNILDTKAPIIGFTCYHTNFMFIRRAAETIKRTDPDRVIIAGGPTPTFSSPAILKLNSGIDICVRGEGEFTTYEVLQCLKNEENLGKVSGISFIRNGEIIQTPDRHLSCNPDIRSALDIYPSPYLYGMIPAGKGIETGITTARGCIFRCTYCNYSAISRWTIRYHSVNRIIAELKLIADYCSDESKKQELHIHDDCFTLSPKRSFAICDALIRENIKLNFWCLTRADRLDRALLEKMRSAGFRTLNFGLESASPSVLRNIKKVRAGKRHSKPTISLGVEKRYLEAVRKNTGIAQEVGFKVWISAIFGLPGETLSDAETTINFIASLKPDRYYHNFLAIYPGTELSATYPKFDIKKAPSDLHAYPSAYAYDVTQVPRLTYEAIEIKPDYMMQLLGIFDGVYSQNQLDEMIFPHHIFWSSHDRYQHIDSVFGWLGRYSDLSTLILLAEPSNNGDQSIAQKSHQYNVSVSKMLRITESTDKNIRINHRNNYLYTLFTTVKRYSSDDNYNNPDRFLHKETSFGCFHLDVKKGLDCFLEDISKGYERGYYTFPAFNYCNYFTIKDMCRWSNQPCPAARLPRMIIRRNRVYPCSHGPSIGCVGNDIRLLRKNVRMLAKAVETERGCDTCAINSSCSRCLSPFPISGPEFCRIRRQFHYLSDALAAFDLGRSMLLLSRLLGTQEGVPRFKIGAETASRKMNGICYNPATTGQSISRRDETNPGNSSKSYKNVRVIAFSDSAVLFRHTDRRYIRLSTTVIEIYEAITRNISHSTLVGYLSRKYNVTRTTAHDWVSESVHILTSHGYLEPAT